MDSQLVLKTIELTRESLSCFSNGLNLLEESGIVVYILQEKVFKPPFPGEYQTCQLTLSSLSVCRYICNCIEGYCEGIYINAFYINNKLRICEIKF